MMESSDILLLIKKYAQGELNDEERKSFERMLSDNPDLQKEVESTKLLMRAAEKTERQRLLSLVQELSVQTESPSVQLLLRERLRRTLKTWAAVFTPPQKLVWRIGIAVLFAAAAIWWFSKPTDRFPEFQKVAYVPPAASDLLRRGTAGNFISTAFREYESGNYWQSLAGLENASPEDSLFLVALLLRGHNHYQLGNYTQAAIVFNELITQQDSSAKYLHPNPDNVAWTRILALLAQYRSDKKEAKRDELLQALNAFLKTANSTDTYHKRAAELQELLKEK